MGYIDLHTHTDRSDGILSLMELVEKEKREEELMEGFRLMISKNRNCDRCRPYTNGILANLDKLGIHLGNYEELLANNMEVQKNEKE